jgi:hypothetical protein
MIDLPPREYIEEYCPEVQKVIAGLEAQNGDLRSWPLIEIGKAIANEIGLDFDENQHPIEAIDAWEFYLTHIADEDQDD